jgi:hypothetical protein
MSPVKSCALIMMPKILPTSYSHPTSVVAHQWPLSAVPAAAAPQTCPAPVAQSQSLQWCNCCRRHRCPHRIIVDVPLLLQADELCHVGGNVDKRVHRLSFRFNGFPALKHLSRATHDITCAIMQQHLHCRTHLLVAPGKKRGSFVNLLRSQV